MADFLIPTLTLAPRAPKKGPETTTLILTATDKQTVFITDEVTVYITKTIETTTSIFDTSFIHVTTTATVTNNSTSTATSTPTLKPPLTTITETLAAPTATQQQHVLGIGIGKKHTIDPFQVLTIVFGVLILVLIALMWFLVRRFYKMYRAERVLRKQVQTEGTELPPMRMRMGMGMGVNEGEEERHVVGEE